MVRKMMQVEGEMKGSVSTANRVQAMEVEEPCLHVVVEGASHDLGRGQ